MPFNLEASLGLNTSAFAGGLSKAQQMASQFGHDLNHKVGHELDHLKGAFAGAFGVAAIEQAFHKAIQFGSKVGELGERFDLNTTKLQAWGFAAEQSGSSIDEVASAMKKLGISQGKALIKDDPTGSIAKSFVQLGVSFDDLRTKNPEQLFEQIAERVHEIGANSQTTAAMIAVMGKTADSLIVAFKEGMIDLAKLFESLGLAIHPEAIAQLKRAEDQLKILAAYGAKTFGTWGAMISYSTDKLGIFLGSLAHLGDFLSETTSVWGKFEGAGSHLWEAWKPFSKEYQDSLKKTKELQEKLRERKGARAEQEETFKKGLEETPDHLKDRVSLEEKLATLRFAAMTDEEKLADIERRRAEALKAWLLPTTDSNDTLRAQQKLLEAEKDKRELEKSMKPESYKFDSLAKIGGFSIGDTTGANALKSIQERQLTVQEKIYEKMQASSGLSDPLSGY